MTQGELEKLSIRICEIQSDMEKRIMEDLVRRIKINGFSTASADWQVERLKQLGKSEHDIKMWVREALQTTDEEIEKIFGDEVYEQYMGQQKAYKMTGQKQIPFEENRELQSVIEAVKEQTRGTFKNLTGSMGFAVRNPATGEIFYTPLGEYYQQVLDSAMLDIRSGAFTYNQVLERVINEMTNSGIRWVDYSSGVHNRVDVAARRAIMTGFRQIQGKLNEQTARALQTDTYEVTYHVGARPSHQEWQGRVWTMKQLQEVCGLGSVSGLHGANCYHDYNPFITGVSIRTYSDKQLAQMVQEENTPKTYNGREYTTYQALQQQRHMETNMRKTRQEINLLKKGEADEETITLKQAKYQIQMNRYADFSDKMKLPRQLDRVYQDGLKGITAKSGIDNTTRQK
ncbi:MAG: minor capsid protein [Lachnospiraceae bacterium]|nr:minor capsid protein [Lachnospiraceae bacterium]